MTLELILVAAFLAGLLGSSHCAGMCGPVVVVFEQGAGPGASPGLLGRRLLYNSGRAAFYALLGAIAGWSGAALTAAAGLVATGRALRILAAVLVILIGLQLLSDARFLAFMEKAGARLWQKLSPLARHVLPINSPARALGAGFLWGALPCGLVYSAAALAATSGSAGAGAMTMLVFWSGTLPLLLAAGAMASSISRWRPRLVHRRLAGVVLIAGGLVALSLPLLSGAGSEGGHQHHSTSGYRILAFTNTVSGW